MRIQPIDVADRPGGPDTDELVVGLHAAYSVAAADDDPGPTISLARFARDICTHTLDARAEAWALVEDGKVIGGYALSLPQLDNRHMGWIFPLVVRPEHRDRGYGSALFEHVLDRMRAHGRTLLLTETPVTGAGSRFARAHGMTVAITVARRTLDLRTADWQGLKRMYPEVEGYSLESWIGPATPELVPDLATLMGGMNDAPRPGDVEEADYSAERIRVREERMTSGGRTCYSTIARRDSDGAPAGYTRIFVSTDRSGGWGEQADTAVLREHRGHRLGLLLKLANLFWMRANEPGIERVITWNATSNAHMLAINEAMGFELFDEWNEWRLAL